MNIPKDSRFILFAVAALAITLFGTSCDDDDKAVDNGEVAFSFSGTITDSVTGLAIDSARVTVGDTTQTSAFYTDSSGNYQGATFGGQIVLFVQAQGYLTQSRDLDLTQDRTGVNFRLLQ